VRVMLVGNDVETRIRSVGEPVCGRTVDCTVVGGDVGLHNTITVLRTSISPAREDLPYLVKDDSAPVMFDCNNPMKSLTAEDSTLPATALMVRNAGKFTVSKTTIPGRMGCASNDLGIVVRVLTVALTPLASYPSMVTLDMSTFAADATDATMSSWNRNKKASSSSCAMLTLDSNTPVATAG